MKGNEMTLLGVRSSKASIVTTGLIEDVRSNSLLVLKVCMFVERDLVH